MIDPTPHDPRLDESAEDYPGVRPGPFDLIALENTRMGLKCVGAGLGLFLLGLPLYAQALRNSGVWASSAGWVLHLAGVALLALGFLITAPTPHGPLPSWLKSLYLLACVASALLTVRHLLRPFIALPDGDTWQSVELWVDHAARLAFLALPWIFWRFCQHRGLTGRALVWLWLGMATAAVAIVVLATEARWLLWSCPALGAIALFSALQTARDLWLDAIYRHTRFAAKTGPVVAVEPLHPASHGPH